MQEWLFVCIQLCPTLCDLMNCILPGSSVHGIFQTKILKQVTISFSRGSSRSRNWTHVSCISYNGRQFLYQLSHQGRSPRDDCTMSFYIKDLIICRFWYTGGVGYPGMNLLWFGGITVNSYVYIYIYISFFSLFNLWYLFAMHIHYMYIFHCSIFDIFLLCIYINWEMSTIANSWIKVDLESLPENQWTDKGLI